MAMTYVQFIQRLGDALQGFHADINFPILVPNVIDIAEQRIYRELELLSTVIRNSSSNLTANSRTFTLPTGGGVIITLTEVNVLTPVGTTTSNGTRNPLVRVSDRFLNFAAPVETATGATAAPTMFAMLTDAVILVGPAPGAAFNVEVVGMIRPTPLSSSNTTTALTTYYPDLFFSAAMTAACYSLGDKMSQMSTFWEGNYQKEFASANAEVARGKYNEFYMASQTKNGATSQVGIA